MSAVEFQDEKRDQSVFRQADYDDTSPADLVLEIPKRGGGTIRLTLLQGAQANEEREEVQENTLIRVLPLAEILDNAPVKSGGVTVNTGLGVALLRPGYLYVFRGQTLWRELEVRPDGCMSDIDIASYRAGKDKRDTPIQRESEGKWAGDLLIPAFLQGRAVIHDYRIAYSEVQWSWQRIQALEADSATLTKRTASLSPAYVATQLGSSQTCVSFDNGFPAESIESVRPLRKRDIGIELMLEQPVNFSPSFEQPESNELCRRLATRLQSIAEEGEQAPDLDISCEPATDALADRRDKKGIACAAVPDVLFKFRHSLAQIHLALQLLDAIELSLKDQPLAHSATLIRQAVFDPRKNGQNPLAGFGETINRSKLDEVLQTSERQYAADIINRHVARLNELMENGELDAVLADYLTQNGIGVCEAYGLCADHLNVLQKIPDILASHGKEPEPGILSSLSRWITNNEWLAAWVPAPSNQADEAAMAQSPYARLQRLAADETDIGRAHQRQLHLQSLALLEQQVQLASRQKPEQQAKHAGQVGKLVSDVLGAWSGAVLSAAQRLIEDDQLEAIHLPRLLRGVSTVSVISDPGLEGIEVMRRGGVNLEQRTIIGVHGDGLSFGLTPFDRTEGVLRRGQDYLYADVLNEDGQLLGSTSTRRAAGEIEEAIQKVSMDAWVFTLPAGHPDVQKFSLTRVDLATKVGKVVNGPQVSRALAWLAVFNLFIESKAFVSAERNSSLHAAKVLGALSDLIAASMKLRIIVTDLSGSDAMKASKFYQISNQALFDLKRVPFISTRLAEAGASTLVRAAGAIAFLGGVIGIGLSAWDMRLSLSRGDDDAAMGHALAMAGGSILTTSLLMDGLLAIPGWGWAVLGIGLLVGGGLYADFAADNPFERLLRNGPLGTHPVDYPAMPSDSDYYGQLLSLLCPIQTSAQRYIDIEPAPSLGHPEYAPQPEDYVITLATPMVSQLRYLGECRPGEPERTFSIVVQEVAYTEIETDTGNPAIGNVRETRLSSVTPLTRITARQSLPRENAIRFLVKRNLKDSKHEGAFQRTTVDTRLRIGVQAAIASEAGTLVYPTPLFEAFEPYNPATHGQPPPKERSYLNPYSNATVPYWFVTEVDV